MKAGDREAQENQMGGGEESMGTGAYPSSQAGLLSLKWI